MEVKNRIAVISNWPDHPNAERENIARIQAAVRQIGACCIVIDKNGYDLETGIEIENDDVDFVISLHFETPKNYDIFSYIALWNPLAFYFEWGYKKCSDHIATHDDSLSCLSTWADDHIQRLIHHDKTRLPPVFTLSHSLSTPIYQPRSINNQNDHPKFFYCGINWERLGNRKGRFEDTLKVLDKKNLVKIYGPKMMQGIDVWEGYRNYVKSIPFDGKTIINEIASCGIALVLSSEAHCQSSLMSNRLFEGLAAGAVIVADQNPFIKKYFGESVLYFDNTGTVKEVTEQIIGCYEWIKKNPEQARSMATKAQQIFLEKFDLSKQLQELLTNHPKRKVQLQELYLAKDEEIQVNMLHILHKPSFDGFEVLLKSLAKQSYKNFSLVVYVNNAIVEDIAAYKTMAVNLDIQCDFIEKTLSDSKGRVLISSGQLVKEFAEGLSDEQLLHVSSGDVKFYIDHLSSLVRQFHDAPEKELFYSDIIAKYYDVNKIEKKQLFRTKSDDLIHSSSIFFIPFMCRANLLKISESYFINYFDNLLFPYLFELVKDNKISTNKTTIQISTLYDIQLLSVQEQLELVRERFILSGTFDTRKELDVYAAINNLPDMSKARLAEMLLKNIPLKTKVRNMAKNIYNSVRQLPI
jgi:hypothetical protein